MANRESLTVSVEFATKRLERSRQREANAARETRLAAAALEIEQARLSAWLVANPDPQLEML